MQETKFDSRETQAKALGMALGSSPDFMDTQLKLLGPEKLLSYLFKIKSSRTHRYGLWYGDFITLKTAVNQVSLCDSNPPEQKKAYSMLVRSLNARAKDFHRWEFVVNDPAFGPMELFTEGDENSA